MKIRVQKRDKLGDRVDQRWRDVVRPRDTEKDRRKSKNIKGGKNIK